MDTEGLHFLHRRHVQTRQRCCRQRTDIGIRVSRILDVQYVAVAPAVDGQQSRDLIHQIGRTADVDCVGPGSAIDGRVPGYGLDIENVISQAAGNRRRSEMRGFDVQGIVARAEHQVDLLEIVVGNPAVERFPRDGGIGPHSQAIKPVFRERAHVVGYAGLVVDIQHIDLRGLGDQHVAVDRRNEVAQSVGRCMLGIRGPRRSEGRRLILEVGVVVGAQIDGISNSAGNGLEVVAGPGRVAKRDRCSARLGQLDGPDR